MDQKSTTKAKVICFALASLCIKSPSQEIVSSTPYLFARCPAGVEELTPSWDGKLLKVLPPDDSEHSFPVEYWATATRQKLPASTSLVGFTQHDKVLRRDGKFYCVFDLQTRQRVQLQNKEIVQYSPTYLFSPQGTRLSLTYVGIIRICDTRSGKQLHRVRYDTTSVSINDVGPTFSPDFKLIAAVPNIPEGTDGSEFRLKIVDVQTGKTRFQLPRLQHHQIGFSPDSRTFWAISSNYFYKNMMVRFWDASTGRLLWATKYQRGVHFTPDSKLYGAPREKDFAIYETRTGRLVRRLAGPTSSNCTAWNFSFNGNAIWSANRNGSIWQRRAK